jgi:hypothetical protein
LKSTIYEQKTLQTAKIASSKMKILSILRDLFGGPSPGLADEHEDARWLEPLDHPEIKRMSLREIADLPLNQIRYACARQGVPVRPPSQTAHC